MAAIWHNGGAGWKLLAPTGFAAEAALHQLVEQAPQILPLAGSPQLTVVGREVRLGSGYADLIAVEPSGRLAIIEVKLANNAEARRAVVAQVLAYAASLTQMEPAEVEEQVLRTHLEERGYASLVEAVRENDQAGVFDEATFSASLAENLIAGRFRLVLVLDRAPEELVRLVGYLEQVTDRLLIDLVTVSAYDLNGSQILVPQRADPEHRLASEPAPSRQLPSHEQTALVEGAADFLASINNARESERPALRRLADWAIALEQAGLVRLSTYHGKSNRLTLLPRLPDEGVGLVTLYNDYGAAYLQVWASVFQRRAPASMAAINELVAPDSIRQGNNLRNLTDELLGLLTAAHREARGLSIDLARSTNENEDSRS